MLKNLSKFGEWLKKLWIPIAGFIGAITLIVQFIELWLGNQEVVTWVTAIVSLIALAIFLTWVGFSKSDNTKGFLLPNNSKFRLMRFPKSYRYAQAGLVFLMVCTIGAGYALYTRIENLSNKVVVIIANFDGPDSEKYRVTEEIITKLKKTFQSDENIVVLPLNFVITEQEGSELARKKGEQYHADLVLWGWYGVTNNGSLLTLHVENLTKSKYIPLQSSELTQMKTALLEIESFTLQQHLAEQTVYLVNSVSGILLYETNKCDQAIDKLSSAIGSGIWADDLINKKTILYYRAGAFLCNSDWEKAIEDLNEVIFIDPELAPAYFNRAVAFARLGKTDDALVDYNKAIDLDPTLPEVYFNRGSLYGEIGEVEKALADFEIAVKENPKSIDTYINRGIIFFQVGNFQDAIRDFTKAIEIQPTLSDPYALRGLSYLYTNEEEKAINDINKSFALNPTSKSDGMLFYFRGIANLNLKKYQEAINDFSRSIQLNPNYSKVYEQRSLVYILQGNYELALDDLNSAEKLDQSNPNLYIMRGSVYKDLGNYELAILDFDRALSLHPDDAIVYLQLGEIYFLLKECDLAKDNLQSVLRLTNDMEIRKRATGLLGFDCQK